MKTVLLVLVLFGLAIAQFQPPPGTGGGSPSAGTPVQKGNGSGGFSNSTLIDDGSTVSTILPFASKAISLGDGNFSAMDYYLGKTSGGSAWAIADAGAASPVAYLMPLSSPTAGQFLSAVAAPAACSGTATLPTINGTSPPTNCTQLQWSGGTNQLITANFGTTTFTAGQTVYVYIGSGATRANESAGGNSYMLRPYTISNLTVDVVATTGASALTITFDNAVATQCTSPSTISLSVPGGTTAQVLTDSHSCTGSAGDRVAMKIVAGAGGNVINQIGSISYILNQ